MRCLRFRRGPGPRRPYVGPWWDIQAHIAQMALRDTLSALPHAPPKESSVLRSHSAFFQPLRSLSAVQHTSSVRQIAERRKQMLHAESR